MECLKHVPSCVRQTDDVGRVHEVTWFTVKNTSVFVSRGFLFLSYVK
jgi:hypothetical protein